MAAETTTLRRIRVRYEDTELHTTRLVGRGWSWECGCGEVGSWNATRDEAMMLARQHRRDKHGAE